MHVLYSTVVAFVLLVGTASMSMAALPQKSDAHSAPAAVPGKVITIACNDLMQTATPGYLAQAERDAATLSPASPLVGLHQLLKMSLVYCKGGGR